MLFLLKALVICVVVYCTALAYLYLFQDRFLFRPSTENPFALDHSPMVPFVYQTPAGMNLRGLWYPPQENKPILIVFHGNKGHLGNRLYKAREFIAQGYGVALVGYRGYSGNPGFPSEKNLMEDGHAAVQAVVNKGYPTSQIVLYGESLGTGIAIRMAHEIMGIKALILEAPYTSIDAVASRHFRIFPVPRLLRHHFNSAAIVDQLKMPILVMHGTLDRTIPVDLGQALFDKMTSPQKDIILFKGGHHVDLYEHKAGEVVDAFLDKLG